MLFFFIFFFIIWVLWPVNITSLILSWVNRKVGWKRKIPEKNHLTTHKQNLACLELGSNPQRWDDKRFRALKISGLNHRGCPNKMTCVLSNDADQPGHLPSLIRVFPVRMKKHCPGRCPGWSVSSLGAQVILLVLLWTGSNLNVSFAYVEPQFGQLKLGFRIDSNLENDIP